jgi:16S rRNA U1498 N3-methylase RsmE
MPLVVQETISLDEGCAHYVRTVLRLKKSYSIILFNGLGGEYHFHNTQLY